MDPKGFMIFKGTKERGAIPDTQETETALIRTKPPFRKEDLLLSRNVMKAMCTSLSCDVCHEPAEVRCNCCKILFCSTLCLLKAEPKHKIVCEANDTFASQKASSLEYLKSDNGSKAELEVKEPAKRSAEKVEDTNFSLPEVKFLSKEDDFPKPHAGKEEPKGIQQRFQTSSENPAKKQSPVDPINGSPLSKVPEFPMNDEASSSKAKSLNPRFSKSPIVTPITPPLTPNDMKTLSRGIQSPSFQNKVTDNSKKTPVQEKASLEHPKIMTPDMFMPSKENQSKNDSKLMTPPITMMQTGLETTKQTKAKPSEPTGPMRPSSSQPRQPTAEMKFKSTSFTPVQIVTTESIDTYWVLDSESYYKTFTIDNDVRSSARKALQEPAINDFCAVIHDNDWYRARVTNLSPLGVFLIDIGLFKNVPHAFELPKHLHVDPPLAVKVWAKDAPPSCLNLPIGSNVLVRGVGVFAEGTIVEMREEMPTGGAESVMEAAPFVFQPHILDQLCVLGNGRFDIKVNKVVGMSGIVGSVKLSEYDVDSYMDCDSLLTSLQSASSPKPDYFKPDVGSVVSAKLDDNWYRGLVYQKSRDDMKVALVDYGLIIKPSSMCDVPENLLTKCALAVFIDLNEGIENIKDLVGNSISATLLSLEKVRVEGYGDARILPWNPKFEDLPESIFPFYSGMSVMISAYYSTSCIYVQPADCIEMIGFFDDVSTVCADEPVLRRIPLCGDLVACNISNLYYRAKVIKRVGEQYEVRLVDYGNLDVVDICNIKDLPVHIKEMPFYATKIGLHQFGNFTFSFPAMDLLSQCCGEATEFKLEAENTLDSVHLITKGGESFNNLLGDLMDITLLTNENLIYEKWTVGKEINMMIVQLSECGHSCAIDLESNVMENIESFVEQLSVYCSSDSQCYKPSVGEVCAAKFGDGEGAQKWYRAVCTDVVGDMCEVYFIDYGNYEKVKSEDIRSIEGHLLTIPVPVKRIVIYGLDVFAPSQKAEIILNLTEQPEKGVVLFDSDSKAIVYLKRINEIMEAYKMPQINQPPISNL